jgi:hypothetical protein
MHARHGGNEKVRPVAASGQKKSFKSYALPTDIIRMTFKAA